MAHGTCVYYRDPWSVRLRLLLDQAAYYVGTCQLYIRPYSVRYRFLFR